MGSDSPPFQLALPLFEGTMEQLVRFVSERKVAAAEVPVALVASQLRAYLSQEEETELEEVGELLIQAAYLLAAKSAGLLFEPETEGYESTEERVRVAADVAVGTSEWLARLQERQSVPSAIPATIPERRIEPREPAELERAWTGMLERRQQEPRHMAVPTFVRIEVAISRLIRRLRSGVSLSFKVMLRGASRQDAVIHFLAVLELIRSKRAAATQPSTFEDITIEYVEDAEPASARAG